MNRSTLTALLVSALIGGSLLTYSMVTHAEAPKAKAKSEAGTPAKEGDYVVIRYKGGEVKKSELDKMWGTMFPGADAPDYDTFDDNVKLEVLKNIARERLVLDKAYAKNVDKTDEVKEQLEVLKRQVVIQIYLKSMMDTLVPEKDVRKEYDVLKEKYAGKEEVRARHILVETEAEAKDIAKKLKGGADFAKLAKEKSADKGSGAEGGDLGYFTKERMVPEFAEIAFKTDKGEISEPVKSDFGWHVIKVEDKRPVKAPAYEEVKARIQQGLATAAVERYVNTLSQESDVKYYGADGKELKADPAAAASSTAAPKAE